MRGQGATSWTLPLALALALAVGVSLGAALPAGAVNPDEMLDDPALEARARVISEDIRCLVCRNENIDFSNADLARDLRLVVRERLVAGDTDDEVRDFLVARYGEYVLLTPPLSLGNAFIWLAGPVLLLGGGLGAVLWMRSHARRRVAGPDAPLSEAERADLARLLKDKE
ncbi:MAG: cytochrome c-type biogenesis protein [Pseudomonadota bacterium]